MKNPETPLLRALATRQDRLEDTEDLRKKWYRVRCATTTLSSNLTEKAIVNPTTKKDVIPFRFKRLLILLNNEWKQKA